MRFGKRRWESKIESNADDSPVAPSDDAVPEGWNVRAEPEPVEAEPLMSVAPPAEREEAVEPPVDGEAVELPMTEVVPGESDEPAAEPETAREFDYSTPIAVVSEPEPEPAAEAGPATPAFFRPAPVAEPPAQPARAPGEPLPPPGVTWAASPIPPAMPFPVAEEPVLVYSSGPGSDPTGVTPLADAGDAHASGHALGMSPSWPEPVMQLASERPEVLVGAAFAGGALFAMILRRLGN